MVVQPPSHRGHVVALTILGWGHAKAACTLLTKIVRVRQVETTLLAPAQFYDRLQKEVADNFIPGIEDGLKDFIRIVGLECGGDPTDSTLLTTGFLDAYKKLCTSEPLKATPNSERTVPAAIPPQLIIIDFFLYDALQGVRRETGNEIPVYALESTSATAVVFFWGPEEFCGNGDLVSKLEALSEADEKALAEEADKIYRRIKGELLNIPGLPPMYDHETSPQKPFMEFPVAQANARVHRFFLECDGVIMNTNTFLEKEAIDAVKTWLAPRPVICPAPFDFPVVPQKKEESPVVVEVDAFLEAALKKHGPHSVFYMSFGSSWWTTEPEKVWAALDVFIENNTPFIFAVASEFAHMPEDIEKKIKESGLGYTARWVPQTSILRHEACGWFVTHCGHNSVTESLTAGVPLICWPFDIDQPLHAALIADVQNAAYELFEIRSWHGLKPIHRLGGKSPEGTVDTFRREFKGVLEKATGEDGKKKRANAQKLREKLAKAWEPDGEAWMEIRRIVDVLH